jgi:hypothetical protein
MKNPVEQLKTRRKENDSVRHSLGEKGEIYYISNPAIGLWAHRDRFTQS